MGKIKDRAAMQANRQRRMGENKMLGGFALGGISIVGGVANPVLGVAGASLAGVTIQSGQEDVVTARHRRAQGAALDDLSQRVRGVSPLQKAARAISGTASPAQSLPMAERKAPGSSKDDPKPRKSTVAEYERYDPRAGRVVKVGSYANPKAR